MSDADLAQQIVDQLITQLVDVPAKTLCVAYSGGLDSHVLLYSLAKAKQLRERFKIKAIHINHQLNPQADLWQTFGAEQCHGLDVEFATRKVTVDCQHGQSLEAQARDARYRALTDLIDAETALLTAHHQDDQAETLLLQLLRGAGPKGLAAMPAIIEFSPSYLLRPMLNFSRAAIESFAKAQQLTWIEDDSNTDCIFDRNYLRHQVMPLLKQRWPEAQTSLARSARLCAEQQQSLESFLAQVLDEIVDPIKPNQLDINQLQAFEQSVQRQLLREWLARCKLPLPSEKKLQHVMQDVIASRADATPCVEWDGAQIRRYQNELYALSPPAEHDASQVIPWDHLTQDLKLPSGLGQLQSKKQQGRGLRINAGQQVSIRFRQNGERMHVHGRQGSHPLKKLMQEWQIPTWQRERIPLLYIDDQLAQVIGYALAEVLSVNAEGEGIIVSKYQK